MCPVVRYFKQIFPRSVTEDDMPNWVIHPFPFSFAASRTDRRHNRNSKRGPTGPTDQTTDRVIKSDDRKAVIAALAPLSLDVVGVFIDCRRRSFRQATCIHACHLLLSFLPSLLSGEKGDFLARSFPCGFCGGRTDDGRVLCLPPSIPACPSLGERV